MISLVESEIPVKLTLLLFSLCRFIPKKIRSSKFILWGWRPQKRGKNGGTISMVSMCSNSLHIDWLNQELSIFIQKKGYSAPISLAFVSKYFGTRMRKTKQKQVYTSSLSPQMRKSLAQRWNMTSWKIWLQKNVWGKFFEPTKLQYHCFTWVVSSYYYWSVFKDKDGFFSLKTKLWAGIKGMSKVWEHLMFSKEDNMMQCRLRQQWPTIKQHSQHL